MDDVPKAKDGNEYGSDGERYASVLERQNQAWSVYLNYQDVFAAVLRGTGPWGIEDGIDLVHDFLVDRLPQALVSFDSKRGAMRPWLFTVFSRYAKRRLLEGAALRKQWMSLETIGELQSQSNFDEFFTTQQLTRIRNAMQSMPDELRMALLAYFGNDRESGNLRAIARKFNWSRHRSRQTVLMALATLAAKIGEHGILTAEELEVCHACFVRGEKWEDISARLKKTEHQVRSLLRSALTKLNASLAKF